MSRSANSAEMTRPLERLSDAVRSLEAAVLLCFASPKKKPVHRLRSWTRRIEAQSELIAMLPNAQQAPKERAKALRILKKLRRAAGAVRDIDVQRELLARQAAHTTGSSRAATALCKEAGSLRRHLRRARDTETDALLALLKKQRTKLPIALKDLCEALAPPEEVSLTDQQLTGLVRSWYKRCAPPNATSEDMEAPHTARKRAKLARYMAEAVRSARASHAPRATRLAAYFEGIQHAGGQWHDLLQLQQSAARQFGKSSTLAQRCSTKTTRALHSFRSKLAQPIF